MNTVQNAPVANVAENGVETKVTFGKVTVTNVYVAKYQKEGTLTAELKQTVDTKSFYPAKSVVSNLQDNPFANDEFGFEKKEFDSQEVRVAWINVPTGSTIESVQAKIDAFGETRLYKILSNHPSISDAQAGGIAAGFTTKDIIANGQAVRYGKDHETMAGKLILDKNGKVQYRGVYWKAGIVEDIDRRTKEVDDVYLTPELKAELNPAGVTVASDNIN